jgi:hypothetical protein
MAQFFGKNVKRVSITPFANSAVTKTKKNDTEMINQNKLREVELAADNHLDKENKKKIRVENKEKGLLERKDAEIILTEDNRQLISE